MNYELGTFDFRYRKQLSPVCKIRLTKWLFQNHKSMETVYLSIFFFVITIIMFVYAILSLL